MTAVEDISGADTFERAGLSRAAVADWGACAAVVTGDYRRDAEDFSRQWRIGTEMLLQLPPKNSRSEAQAAAAVEIIRRDRAAREKFLGAYAETVYRRLTDNFTKFIRVEHLVRDAAVAVPGLAPNDTALARENDIPTAAQGWL